MKKNMGYTKMALHEAVRLMPPLRHWPDKNVPWKIEDSEVVKWLVKQPEMMVCVFEWMKNAGWIAFKKDGYWVGQTEKEIKKNASVKYLRKKIRELQAKLGAA